MTTPQARCGSSGGFLKYPYSLFLLIAVDHFFASYIFIDCNCKALQHFNQQHLLDRAIKRGLTTLNIPVLVAVRKYLMEADIFLSGDRIMGNLMFSSNSMFSIRNRRENSKILLFSEQRDGSWVGRSLNLITLADLFY